MPIVATAGHVDHGKSTLVEALTGTDPDRWQEEKDRGLTIDLGFAWTDIGGHDVGFVDVPGHERFIKNMLAGVGAVDCALLVVAADSGWMPQTEEHAAVLDLLAVERGVVAVTRADLVDEDTLELTVLEVIEETAGTGLAEWPVITVSATTGSGLDDIRSAIAAALSHAPLEREVPVRMWIDRAFTIAGAGQVVTGTVMEGSIAIDDQLAVLPAGDRVRVRGLHHHGGAVHTVSAGDRSAIDVAGAGEAPQRGDLIAAPGTVDVTDRLLVSLTPTRTVESMPPRGAFHLHIGTASRPARVRAIGPDGLYLLQCDEHVPASIGDRLIVRDSGRKSVVAGGRVIDTRPPRRVDPGGVARIEAVLDSDPDTIAQALVETHGIVATDWMAAATRGGRPPDAIAIPGGWMSRAEADALDGRVKDLVVAYQQQHPARPGMPKAELTSQLEIGQGVLDSVIAESSDLAEVDGAVRTGDFSDELSPEQEEQWRDVRAALEASFDVPRLRSLDLAPETVHFLLRRGDLVRVGDDLAFTAGQAESIHDRVSELDDGFTVSEFKDHFGMARRQAVPTLEWLDARGRTRRSGDGRSVRGR